MRYLASSIALYLCAFAIIRSSSGQSTHPQEIHCARERSRTAWKIIDEYLLPFVEQEGYKLPEDCRLNPKNDMFREQELKKEHVTAHQWQCLYCKKMFRSEKYLDQHFDNRHSDLVEYTRERCLADVCGALHCDYYDTVVQSKKKRRKCNTPASDRNLHLCQSLARTCFPPENGASARRLNEFFLRQFCDPHDCRKRLEPFNRGNGRYGDRALYIALFVFVCLLLLLYYLGIYAHLSDLNQIHIKMKRITKVKAHKK